MSQEDPISPPAQDETMAPAGRLPPWRQADLPVPPTFGLKNSLRMIGPGVIAVGMTIGAGEWLFGPVATVQYQGRLMSVVVLVIFFQAILNTECIRYTLYTGEPIFTGYMRLWPGPRFWACFFIFIDLITSFWPGFALTAATALAAMYLGPQTLPGAEHQALVNQFGYGILLACAFLFLFGGKVYNSMERAMSVMVVFLLGYLLFVGITMIDGSTWGTIAAGIVRFDSIVDVGNSGQFLVIGAFIGYSGLGGLGNATISNYVRDKGWGMGSVVGAIPSAFGGKTLRLSHIGAVFPINPQNLSLWKKWWRYVAIDQYGIWAVGSFIGMALPCAIGLQFLKPESAINEWGAAVAQANGIAKVGGPVFWYLTLICGFFILLSTQLGAIDILPRRWTDIIWTGFPSVRKKSERSIGKLYYAIIGLYVLWCLLVIALALKTPFYLVVLMANMALFPIVVTCVMTIIVNRRFLPTVLRPRRWREAVLVLAALCYAGFFTATTVLDEKGFIRLLLKSLGILQ